MNNKTYNFITDYDNNLVNTFTLYKFPTRKGTKFWLKVRLDSGIKYDIDSKSFSIDTFLNFLDKELNLNTLMGNNLYHNNFEQKYHFYIKNKMQFQNGKTQINDTGIYRDVPAEEIDMTILNEFLER